MSRKHKKARNRTESIHSNKLIPCRKARLLTAFAIEERFLKLCHLWPQMRNDEELPIDGDVDQLLVMWRTAMVRFKQADYRIREDEWEAIKKLAQWTLDMKCDLFDEIYVAIQWQF